MIPDFAADQKTAVLWLLVVATVLILVTAVVFAVLAVALRLLKTRRERREERLRRLWTRPVLDAVSDLDGCSFRHAIPRRDRLLFVEFLARLSMSLSPVEQPCLARIAEPYMYVVRKLLRDRDVEFRALGVQLLGLLGAENHRRLLIWASNDAAPIVALTAVRALAATDQVDDVDRILEVLPRFESWGRPALSSLMIACGARALPRLREVLADEDQLSRLRAAAGEALRWLDDLSATEIAEQVLLKRTDREVAASCLRIIQRLGSEKQIPVLRRYVRDHDPVLRLHAVSGLAAMGGDDSADLLSQSLGDPSHWVAIRAARGLHKLRRQDLLRSAVEMRHPRAALAGQYVDATGDNNA